MAMPVLPVALFLMMAHVVSTHILQTSYLASSPERGRVAIPEDGIYVVSATLDGDRSREPELSVLTIYKNRSYMFQVDMYHGVVAGAGVAVSLNRDDVILAYSPEGPFQGTTLLSVSYVAPADNVTFSTMMALNPFTYSDGLPIDLPDVWFRNVGNGIENWYRESENTTYYQITRQGIYWVMGFVEFLYPNETVDVRYTMTSLYDRNDTVFLFTVWTEVGMSSGFASGAFLLPVDAKVFMTPRSRPVRIQPGSLLSLLELKNPDPDTRLAAFTAYAGVTERMGCRWFLRVRENFDPRSILKYLPPLDLTVPDNEFVGKRSTRRRTAAMAALREAGGQVEGDKRQKRAFGDFQRPEQQGPFPIYWTRQIVTNVGNMAFTGGTWIQIRSSGAYLVGIRPDNMEGDDYIAYRITKNDTEIWKVLCDHSPGGQMAAFHCMANERMQIIQAGSTHCGVGIMSLISVAQTRIIEG